MSSRPVEIESPYWELIKPISKLEKLSLVLEILRDYGRVRWLLARRALPAVVAELRGATPAATDPQLQAIGKRLGHVVQRTLSPLPFDSRCLARSLVLISVLSRRGIATTLVIGVAVEPSFAAHAWVESGGVPLLSPFETNRLVEI
jgi:hypothetical protein